MLGETEKEENELFDMDESSEIKKSKRDNDDRELNSENKEVYPCEQYEYTGSRRALYHHIRSKHEGIIFDLCDYAATTLTNLKQHKEFKHEGIRYPCHQCEYAAVTASCLKIETAQRV